MESNVDNSTQEPKPAPVNSSPSIRAHTNNCVILIICFVISITAGSASGWWFAKANSYDIYVLDIKGLVEAKKKDVFDKYKSNPSPEAIAAAEKEIVSYLHQLDSKITELGSNTRKIVLLKDIYLAGNATDLTEQLKNIRTQE